MKPTIIKGATSKAGTFTYTPYYFMNTPRQGARLIGLLTADTINPHITASRRTDMARTIHKLRSTGYRFIHMYGRHQYPADTLHDLQQPGATLVCDMATGGTGIFKQHHFTDWQGTVVMPTGTRYAFLFRIYDEAMVRKLESETLKLFANSDIPRETEILLRHLI